MKTLVKVTDYKLVAQGKEHNPFPSKTIQNEAFTIRQIYEKYTRGLDLGITRQGIFEEDSDHDDYDKEKLSHLDLAEREELMQMSNNYINDFKENVKRAKDSRGQDSKNVASEAEPVNTSKA